MNVINTATQEELFPSKIVSTLPSVRLIKGAEAIKLLQSSHFKQQWELLYQECPWATAFQHWGYVQPWYNLHQDLYIPIVISAESDSGLNGLLTMALLKDPKAHSTLRNKRARIVHAGDSEAEYQTWIAVPGQETTFIKEALSLLLKNFPKCDIVLKYIPSQAGLEWTASAPYWQKRSVVQVYRRPLMEMNSPEVTKLFRKRGFKLKLNRLKRLGDLKFEHITDYRQFVSFFDQLRHQFDFRQGAMFNKNLFRDSPKAANLLLEMFENNLLHVTVLSIGEEIVASIVGVKGKNWVHLGGINTHSPFYAAHSPGFVHFLLLGQLLASEHSATVFDLTPGGDAYKERMATSHDQVYELLITESLGYALKRKFRKLLHGRLMRAGHRPMSVELHLKKQLYLLRNRLKGIRHGQWPTTTLRKALHMYKAPTEGTRNNLLIGCNSLQDLLSFENGGTRLTRWEFLEDAMARFENGQQAYTLCQNGQLLCCAWLNSPEAIEEDEQQVASLQLELSYCLPQAAAMLTPFITGTYSTIAQKGNSLTVLFVADALDYDLAESLKVAGFEKGIAV